MGRKRTQASEGKKPPAKNTVAGFISKGSLYKNGEINVPTKFPGFMHTPNEVYIDIYIYFES